MRKFLVFIILSLIQLNSVLAENLENLEISGISVGESLLSHYSKDEIQYSIKNTKNFYKDKKFMGITLPTNNNEYDKIQVVLKPSDKNYKIFSISGMMNFDSDMIGCKKKMTIILNDIKESIPSIKFQKADSIHGYDKTGKSMTYGYLFYFKNGAIDLYCTDWGDKISAEKNWVDNLRLVLHSLEMRTFLESGDAF